MASHADIIIVTGATGAIGSALSQRVAAAMQPGGIFAGAHLVLACRNLAKAQSLKQEIASRCGDAAVEVTRLDLADEESVKTFAAGMARRQGAMMLVNNAGVMRRHYGRDAAGRELSLAVNYHNTRLLTDMLLHTGRLRRVVFTTSLTRFFFRAGVPCRAVTERSFRQLRTYGFSKRLITDYAAALHREGRAEVTCADPGVVDTGMIAMQRWYDPLANILFRPFIRTPRQGADPAWRAMTLKPGFIYCRHRSRNLPK